MHPPRKARAMAKVQTLRPASESTTLLDPPITDSTGPWIWSGLSPLVGRIAISFHNCCLGSYSSISSCKLRLVTHCHRLFFVQPSLFIYRTYRRRIISRQYHLLPEDAMESDNSASPHDASSSITDAIQPSPSDIEKALLKDSPSATASNTRRRRLLIWTSISIAIAAVIALGMLSQTIEQ